MDAKVAEYPLAIDLDGTLLRVDSLIEMFVVNLLRQPLATLVALLALVRGRAAFKKHMVEINLGDVTRFPIHSEFMAYLLEQKASGRSLFLVTAADQEMADTIARKLGIFSGAAGSTDGHNLKGTSKLSYLQERFPDGFSYAGDSPADLPIWQEAKSIVLVGVSNRVRKAVARMQRPIEQEFQADTINPGIWFKALRAHQWSKNLLMFVPLILSHKYSDPAAVTHVALAFIYMSLIASGTYLINDLSDLDSDRAHPTKRNRAVASGTVGAGTALTIALSCIVAGLIGALSLSKLFLLLLLVYVAITLAYSFYIKRIAMLDVVTLGALYMLRVMMGTVVLPVALSPWLLMFSLFFFLGFSLAKRYVEIAAGGEYYGADELIRGRGYRISDGPLLVAFGISTSVIAILILALYIVNEAFPVGAYEHPQWLWLIVPMVLLWTMRIWLLCFRGEMDDDPVAFAVGDRVSWLLGLLIIAFFMIAVQ